MRAVAVRMPVARYVLRGWQAAIWARKLEVPGPAQPYFENLHADGEELRDMPTSLVVLHVSDVENESVDEWDDGDLAFLLRKWNEMTL